MKIYNVDFFLSSSDWNLSNQGKDTQLVSIQNWVDLQQGCQKHYEQGLLLLKKSWECRCQWNMHKWRKSFTVYAFAISVVSAERYVSMLLYKGIFNCCATNGLSVVAIMDCPLKRARGHQHRFLASAFLRTECSEQPAPKLVLYLAASRGTTLWSAPSSNLDNLKMFEQ